MTTKELNVRLPAGVYDRLWELCVERKTTLATLLEELVEREPEQVLFPLDGLVRSESL